MTDQCAADIEPSQVFEELEIHARELERRNSYLKKTLAETRASPFTTLKDTFAFSLLTLLARAEPLIPSRVAARFRASARKRDPRRDDFLISERYKEFPFSYKMVLDHWALQRRAQKDDTAQLKNEFADGPLVSIVISIKHFDAESIEKAFGSVLAQSYKNWEMLLLPTVSENGISAFLSDLAKSHTNVNVLGPGEGASTSTRMNNAITAICGKLVHFMDATDVLDPDALLLVVKELCQKRGLKIIYTDEDYVSKHGKRYHPHFKPDWNRELFYGTNYISRAVFLDRQVVTAAGGFQEEYGDAQQYDLLLRCIEIIEDIQIGHIPKVLFSRRTHDPVFDGTSRPMQRALSDHLARVHGKPLQVVDGYLPGTCRVVWPLETEPLVSIIIPTRDKLSLTRTAVESILRETAYQSFEILIVDNGSNEPETLEWFDMVDRTTDNLRIIHDNRPFNYSALNNGAVRQSKGEIIALVNNDVEVQKGEWLSEMVSLAVRPDTGCVGAKLYFPDGRIQHAGVRVGFNGVASHPFLFFPGKHPGYFGRLGMRQELSAVTAACLLLRRSIFEEVGGLNETDLAIAYNDVDLCLKVASAGYRNIWTPYAELVHHESASRGRDNTPDKRRRLHSEIGFMKRKWKTEVFNDPAYNTNLSLIDLDAMYTPPLWRL